MRFEMRCILELFFKTFFVTIFIVASSRNVAGQVFELTLQNFDQYTRDKDVMLVEFFAPWCHHCQAFAPEWEKAAAALAVNREYILGRADCFGTGKELCDRFHVQMYPMVKLFRHGVFQEDFEGDRTADAVIRYLQQAQSQPAAPRAPDGGAIPNTDPWQTGASFQYPMAAPVINQPVQPVQAFQPVQQTPEPYYQPTPELQQTYPNVQRAETKPPQPVPTAQNGNFWFNNNLWNRLKQQPPSISSLINNNNNKPFQPQLGAFAQQQQPTNVGKPVPEMPQNSVASTSLEFNSRDNTPFQAQTSTSQIGLKPPSASIALPASPITGAYQGQLSAQNNEGASLIFIEGRPYAIRRIVNRYSNHHYPISLAAFQPNQRFGPVFLRGDNIPHVIKPLTPNNPTQPKFSPPGRLASLRPISPILQSAQHQNFDFRQQVLRMQPVKAPVIKNNVPKSLDTTQTYLQMLSKFLQGRNIQKSELGQKRTPANNRRYLVSPPQRQYQTAQPPWNKIFQSYKRKLTNEIQSRLPYRANTQERLPFSAQKNAQASGRFVISIKGKPGSKAVAAIKNKALNSPGFLNNLLNGRSYLSRRQQIQRQKQQQQQAQRRQQLWRHNNVKRIKIQSPALVNVPQTDRALIRAKVLRPDLLARAKWAAKGAQRGTARGNIVYVPRSAFSRLPPWYRPKLGPAIVKYVVKTDDIRKPFPMLAQANKKQALVRPPPPGDLWHQIYRFYNRKSELQMRDAPYRPKFTPSPLINRRPNLKFNLQNQPALKPASQQKYYVNQPQFRVRNNPNLQQKAGITNPYNRPNYMTPKRNPVNANRPLTTNFKKINSPLKNNKDIPPELWDKRSIIERINKKSDIPRRPIRGGKWGTLKKKRSAFAKERSHRRKRLNRHRRFLLRKIKNSMSRKHGKIQHDIIREDDE